MEEISLSPSIQDHATLLQAYGITPTHSGYYWQAGEISQTQGWIIHLSVIQRQVYDLFSLIIPLLIQEQIPFKIPRDMDIAINILEGSLGYIHLGKILSIYPANDAKANVLASRLIEITAGFTGPAIPTDRRLGGIVYTRYGSHNPVRIKDSNGQTIKCIYDVKGKLIQDPYQIPFQLPDHITWPFKGIANSIEKGHKLLNFAYYPIFTLKSDVKGNVWKALYFQKFWRIRSCVIKEGRADMFIDDAGRSTQHRLQWQYDLYRALSKDIPIPEIFDYFEENGNTYLAMSYINGISFTQLIDTTYQGRCWQDLPLKAQLFLLEHLMTVLSIIKQLHGKGFIHRDITPENFLVDRKGRTFLIDMELTWCIVTQSPNPPFGIGTPEYMSPEQAVGSLPTLKEDIYSIGALMIAIFTNISPFKFDKVSKKRLIDSLHFFVGSDMISNLITECLEPNPGGRPDITAILEVVAHFRNQIKNGNNSNLKSDCSFPSLTEVKYIIQSGIEGLSFPALLSPQRCWISPVQHQEQHIGNHQMGAALYEGWHTGMTGPIWLLARAKKFGFDISSCGASYEASWKYIETRIFSQQEVPGGLFTGGAGIALTLAESFQQEILPIDITISESMEKCFRSIPTTLPFAAGLAGRGMALLHCAPLIHNSIQEILHQHVQSFLQFQQRDGSWFLPSSTKKHLNLGLKDGQAGICWFLLFYLDRYPDATIRSLVIRGLNWLEKKIDKILDFKSMENGIPGIALVFIKAFETLQDLRYKEIAIQTLSQIPPQPVLMDFSFGSGLAGLGETYLEASRIFDDQEWKIRADWIAALLAHTFRSSKETGQNWLVNLVPMYTADLFHGGSGVLHFLIHYLFPDECRHPLSPVFKKD